MIALAHSRSATELPLLALKNCPEHTSCEAESSSKAPWELTNVSRTQRCAHRPANTQRHSCCAHHSKGAPGSAECILNPFLVPRKSVFVIHVDLLNSTQSCIFPEASVGPINNSALPPRLWAAAGSLTCYKSQSPPHPLPLAGEFALLSRRLEGKAQASPSLGEKRPCTPLCSSKVRTGGPLQPRTGLGHSMAPGMWLSQAPCLWPLSPLSEQTSLQINLLFLPFSLSAG